jgi:hypothetical protein
MADRMCIFAGRHAGTKHRNRLAKNAGLAILVEVVEASGKSTDAHYRWMRDPLRWGTEVSDMDGIKQ